MCVICYQTRADELLTYDEIKAMCEKNPHGFGWMANLGDDKIKFKKGYFDVDEFYNDYILLRNNPNLVDLALHMRIATGSEINAAMCHPFPITSNKDFIKQSEGYSDVELMMNGILFGSTKEFSDTALYTMNQLNNYYKADKRFFLHFNKRQEMLFENEISGTRFIFMCKDGTRLFGQGWSDYNNKAKVSNRYWIPVRYYDDYDDDYYYGTVKQSQKRYKSYIDYLLDNCK